MADYELGGHELESPLINAAGSVNGTSPDLILREVTELAGTGIGAITVGSFTVPAQAGNEARFGAPVYYHDSATGATYNSMGLPNIGLAEATRLMPKIVAIAHERGKPVIANVSPTQPSAEIGDTFEQTVQLVGTLQGTGVDLIEVNTSCPNVVTTGGGRKPILGYDLEGMTRLVEQLEPLVEVGHTRIGVKLPPYLSEEELRIVPQLAQLFREHPVFEFIVTANTIPGQIPRGSTGEPILTVPGGAGGMSGATTREVGREQLRLWRAQMGSGIEVVSTLGVVDGRELAVRRQLGATAAGGVTFLWEADSLGRAVTDMLTQWTEAEE